MSIAKTVQNNTQAKKHCIICRQNTGILICHGCQLTFCGKHVIKHRQELTNQLDDIMQNHDLLRQDIDQSSNEYFYLRKIAEWENETIKQIKKYAERARIDLKQIFEKTKRQLIRKARDINFDLNTSWKADDFAEKELIKWTKQLNELRIEIKSAYSAQLIEDQRYPIYPITLMNNTFRNHLTANKSLNPIPYECFFKTTSSGSIENNGLIAKHIGPDTDFAHILGKRLYSQGYHTTRFKIQQSSLPYTIFFGCISSAIPQNPINYNSSSVVGWFGYNEIYQHGIWNNNLSLHGYESNEIQTDDILNLIFDCDHKQIELFHERMNRTYKLSVDIDKAPFPWQILVVLVHEDDCVKILPNR